MQLAAVKSKCMLLLPLLKWSFQHILTGHVLGRLGPVTRRASGGRRQRAHGARADRSCRRRRNRHNRGTPPIPIWLSQTPSHLKTRVHARDYPHAVWLIGFAQDAARGQHDTTRHDRRSRRRAAGGRRGDRHHMCRDQRRRYARVRACAIYGRRY